MAHLLWATLGCRVWIEWIDSDSNPSDGLSRKGMTDPWTQKQKWILSSVELPPELLHKHPLDMLWDRFASD